jgi:hypothetical protein
MKLINRLSFIFNHIVEQVDGSIDLVSAMFKQMDGEKGGEKLSTVYKSIKKIVRAESPLKHYNISY